MLCLCFGGKIYSQNTTTKITPLTPGSKVPDSFWQVNHSFLTNGKSVKQSLAAYKGRLLIIDFWATWCAPCLAMLPKLEALRSRFPQIHIVSASYMGADTIRSFMAANKQINPALQTITNDNYLRKIFPHLTLPHFVWINEEGKIAAITGAEEITANQIEAALKGNYGFTYKEEKPIKYNAAKPLITQHIEEHTRQLLISSIMSKHVEGLQPLFITQYQTDSTGYRASYLNLSVANLFALAYTNLGNFRRQRFITDQVDSLPFTYPKDRLQLREWSKKNTYCYELTIAPELHKSINDFYHQMQRDMENYFPYKASIETRRLKCLALIRTDSTKALLTQHKNSPGKRKIDFNGFDGINIRLDRLIQPLSTYYLQKYPLPVVDNTGYPEPVDVSFKADMTSVQSINKGLLPYGLQFVEKEADVAVLVLRYRK